MTYYLFIFLFQEITKTCMIYQTESPKMRTVMILLDLLTLKRKVNTSILKELSQFIDPMRNSS